MVTGWCFAFVVHAGFMNMTGAQLKKSKGPKGRGKHLFGESKQVCYYERKRIIQ
jgi:hypothetical protein